MKLPWISFGPAKITEMILETESTVNWESLRASLGVHSWVSEARAHNSDGIRTSTATVYTLVESAHISGDQCEGSPVRLEHGIGWSQRGESVRAPAGWPCLTHRQEESLYKSKEDWGWIRPVLEMVRTLVWWRVGEAWKSSRRLWSFDQRKVFGHSSDQWKPVF